MYVLFTKGDVIEGNFGRWGPAGSASLLELCFPRNGKHIKNGVSTREEA